MWPVDYFLCMPMQQDAGLQTTTSDAMMSSWHRVHRTARKETRLHQQCISYGLRTRPSLEKGRGQGEPRPRGRGSASHMKRRRSDWTAKSPGPTTDHGRWSRGRALRPPWPAWPRPWPTTNTTFNCITTALMTEPIPSFHCLVMDYRARGFTSRQVCCK